MTIATWITILRFLIAPIMYLQLTSGSPHAMRWALALLLLAGFTDMLDGWVARIRGEISELGKTLDPLADKVVVLLFLIGLAVKWGLPLWMMWLYLIKEVIQVIASALILKKYEQLISANFWGKSATVCFFLGFILYALNRNIGLAIITIAIPWSIYAMFTYYQAYLLLKK